MDPFFGTFKVVFEQGFFLFFISLLVHWIVNLNDIQSYDNDELRSGCLVSEGSNHIPLL